MIKQAIQWAFFVKEHRSLQIGIVCSLYLILAPFLPYDCHRLFYTCSLIIKDLLIWLMPLTVAFFIAHAIFSFERKALLFVIILLLFEGISNFLSVIYAYGGGIIASSSLHITLTQATDSVLTPLWRIPLVRPLFWSADKGSCIGVLAGLMAALFPLFYLKQAIVKGKQFFEWILTRFFARLIPLFILGFLANIYQQHLFHSLTLQLASIVVWLIALQSLYLAMLFWVGSKGSWRGMIESWKNLLPAGTLAFTSGCSLSTMPWTIEGTSKNLQDGKMAKALIPATTNIQQIGDCIANGFLCFLIYHTFYGHPPDPLTWLAFSSLFVLARFATAAVIGGAIFIMLPIYESHLYFNSEMIAIILAFNVVFDPIITSFNVMANGALCSIFEIVWNRIQKVFINV